MDVFGPLQYVTGLAYRCVGVGPTLLLLHGGTGSRTHWSRNIISLSAHFRVVTLDLPGFGESAAPSVELDPESYVEWVASSLKQYIGPKPFHLAAFSFGAAVATRILSRCEEFGLHPLRMTLLGPAGFGKPEGRNIDLEKVPRNGQVAEAEIREATARNLGRRMLYPAPEAQDEAVRSEKRRVGNEGVSTCRSRWSPYH